MFSTGSCHYVSSSKSFLFSLYNINGYAPVKVNIKSGHYSYAIFTCPDWGPSFGGGHDWWIANNAASNHNSYTYCGSSYPLPPGYSASGASCQFYAGSNKFTPTDVEVFYETTTECVYANLFVDSANFHGPGLARLEMKVTILKFLFEIIVYYSAFLECFHLQFKTI